MNLLNFDYTYISVFGYPVFEPMVILTNVIMFLICYSAFRKLRRFDVKYARQMGLFLLLLGISVIFGAVGHSVHLQLGSRFFNTVVVLMNVFSMVAIYYCFRAPFDYTAKAKKQNRHLVNLVRIWVVLLLFLAITRGDFLLLKVNAGIVLLYSLVAHYRAHKVKAERGNLLVVYGILVSFLPIVIHSMKLSLHEWFNHKDLAHVVMIFSLILIIRGVKLNAEDLHEQEQAALQAEAE